MQNEKCENCYYSRFWDSAYNECHRYPPNPMIAATSNYFWAWIKSWFRKPLFRRKSFWSSNHPTNVIYWGESTKGWPMVAFDDWCGEWKPEPTTP